MTYARSRLISDPDSVLRMPTWVTAIGIETSEDGAFCSGAALAVLHNVVNHPDLPQALWRERLALRAAETCVKFSGRPERASDLRDSVHLLRTGDQPGPAGEIYVAWRSAVERTTSVMAMHRSLPAHQPEQIAAWLDVGAAGPIGRAADTLETVLAEMPHADVAALILADAALAQALGWSHVVPLLATSFKRRDLQASGDALRHACHLAVIKSAAEAARTATDLLRRADKLRAVAPKLRAKAAGEAVNVFLTRDAVSPAALSNPINGTGLSSRAARRLCDRLVDLGAVRELTGRNTFRLYGV